MKILLVPIIIILVLSLGYLINARIVAYDVYTCENFDSPQMPEWCDILLKQEKIKSP